MMQLSDDLLSGADAAAAFIGLPRRAVYRMTESGQLPVIRMGRRLFYRKSDLERAFQANAVA
jgi:excisionase family DNA binding protein